MIESDYGLCNICFESVPCANMLVLSKCGCSFCRECLTMYVISVLRDRIDISCSCPSYRCSQGGWLTDSEIKELLPSDFYERFSMKKLQREVEQNVNLTFCPAVNCGAVCQISANLNMNLSNGTNPPLKSNRRALKRFCRWYKRRICNSHEHDAPNPKGAVFHDSSGLRIPNISYATSNNTVISKIGDRVTKSLDQSVEQKDLPFVAERGALAYQATPSRPAVRVVCKRCSHEFCARCHLNWHVGGGPYVCEETIENIVHRKKHKKFGTRLSNHQDSCEHLEKNVDTLTAANHIGLYPYLSPETSVRSKLPHTEAKPEYINKLTSLKKPTEKDKIKKISFQRSKTKQSSYSQKHTGIHLFNNDISDNIDVSVLTVGFPPYSPDDWLKRCPACLVPIERIEGCAQMMCRSCKHTFCWYCLTSLDDDFLLQHYDDGACKGKLGHSRASVIGHRVYVISVFTGLTILLLVAAPFIMVAVPCIICAKCHRIYHQYRSRKRHTKGLYAGNGCVPTATNFSSIQTKPEDASQPASSSPHHSIFVSSCRSSVVNTDFNKTVEQKADIHWLPCQEDSKHASLQKAMHRSSSVPVHCCTTASNLVITPYTP